MLNNLQRLNKLEKRMKPDTEGDGVNVELVIHEIVRGEDRQSGIEYVPATDPALKGRDVWVTKDPSEVINYKGD